MWQIEPEIKGQVPLPNNSSLIDLIYQQDKAFLDVDIPTRSTTSSQS